MERILSLHEIVQKTGRPGRRVMDIPGVFPDKIKLFGVQWSETLVTAYTVTALVIIAALIFRFVIFRNFKQVPRGFQNVLEMCVAGASRFCTNILGEHGSAIAPYILTLFVYIIANGAVEFIGVRSAVTDLNCTIGMALISSTNGRKSRRRRRTRNTSGCSPASPGTPGRPSRTEIWSVDMSTREPLS